ncbi:hypothetical protein FOS14_17305 [Skermania sp. ID1734]|uniref:hypothetical protein n=1 Tax=Skermania sp. ID1734 TaxID=2597516 RepID=UPI00117C5941|nr:hypothetical protein [Skermania sp. ID1734]TSD96133.1 hypothetical protein FOS14_17305 [Skermania sp. ID1734]
MSRRTSLRVARNVAVAGFGAAALVSCADPNDTTEPPAVDPLVAQADLARRDAAAAQAAIAVLPDRSADLRLIADQRTAHAKALDTEIARVAGAYPNGSHSPGPAAATSTVAPAPPPNLDAMRASLSESQRSAAGLAPSLSGYRAGLLGSISAACGVYATVVLK